MPSIMCAGNVQWDNSKAYGHRKTHMAVSNTIAYQIMEEEDRRIIRVLSLHHDFENRNNSDKFVYCSRCHNRIEIAKMSICDMEVVEQIINS